MDSPARTEKIKASQKHIEFQLQREKTYTRELEDKIKTQQAHIAKLEQDKAELRREKLTLADDEKRKSKLEEKCHALQRELTEKHGMLIAEQKRVSVIETEKEQIRRDAHASIAKWCEAEKQWIAENEGLQNELDEKKDALAMTKNEFEALRKSREELQSHLLRERERCARQESAVSALEKQVSSLHSRIEGLQNEIYTRDETIFKLDEAGGKWQETCRSKDDEIKDLEVQLSKQSGINEKLQCTITTLNQRIEASKMINLEEKGRVERISCDLTESQKENKLLRLELETLRRELEHTSQSTSKHQDVISDFRVKLTASNEQIKEKCVELRKYELTNSKLTADVKQLEREATERAFLVTSLEGQLQSMRDSLTQLRSSVDTLEGEKSLLAAELQLVKSTHETRDETVVLMKSEYEDNIESLLGDIKTLESEVSARQQMINSITDQLGDVNKKSEELYAKSIADTERNTLLYGELTDVRSKCDNLSIENLILSEDSHRLLLREQWWVEVCDFFSIHSGFVTISLTTSEERMSALLRNLREESHLAHATLEATNSRLRDDLQHAKHTEARLTEEVELKHQELISSENRVKLLEQTVYQIQQEAVSNSELRIELVKMNDVLTEKNAALHKLIEENTALSEKQSIRSQKLSTIVNAITDSFFYMHESYAVSLADKLNTVIASFKSVYNEENEQLRNALKASEGSSRSATEEAAKLHSRLSVERAEWEESEKKLLTLRESLLTKLQTLETQYSELQKENDIILKRSESLEKHREDGNASKDEKIQELLLAVSMEKRKLQTTEEALVKLRESLNYVCERKKEYKRALEEVKVKREEVERNRATEKDWSMRAISRANGEIRYWVESFDKLKSMINDLTQRSGTEVSPVDQATIDRFEEAKSRLTLRNHNVNAAPQLVNREKRQRSELQDENNNN